MNQPGEISPQSCVPAFVVEYLLLGKTRRDTPERYTQNGGIVADVWLAFARDLATPCRVLISPRSETTAVDLGAHLHDAIHAYRRKYAPERPAAVDVSPLESFVSVALYFDELIRVVLPLTPWWQAKGLSMLSGDSAAVDDLVPMLFQAIRLHLGNRRADEDVELRKRSIAPGTFPDRRVLEAAPLAALVAVFMLALDSAEVSHDLQRLAPRRGEDNDAFVRWIGERADRIADRAIKELVWHRRDGGQAPPARELVQRVFLDRTAALADAEALCTIKADAAFRVFDVSCRGIAWGIVDCGIAAGHPAFADHAANAANGKPPSRVRATYDFTLIRRIRNFDLTLQKEDSAERRALIEALAALPGRPEPTPEWRRMVAEKLEAIAHDLRKRIPPDWSLIQPLIEIADVGDGTGLVSDHGTHVAGILGGDWRETVGAPPHTATLRGVCPDIRLYDLRVIDHENFEGSEFALLAALEFVGFFNRRAGTSTPQIHGVNVSLSIPHDVRNYGCGATPVCVAADRLVASGVVVVAAAGNRGWNEQAAGFGNFVFCSITDPGNAHDVITVGATHRQRPHTYGVSYFSSRGPTGDGRAKPDLVAPGEQIRGPVRGDSEETLDGTSMAAPFVSGAAAMLLARHRELIGDPQRVKDILCRSATDLHRERYFQGHGLVDVLRALQSV